MISDGQTVVIVKTCSIKPSNEKGASQVTPISETIIGNLVEIDI